MSGELAPAEGVLPADLPASDRVMLRGVFKLTVVAVRDVGQPIPQKNPAAGEEVEQRAKPTRTLKLLLSDGSVEVAAMEYESAPLLDSIRPGSHVFLQDVWALRGLLLLTPKCVKMVI